MRPAASLLCGLALALSACEGGGDPVDQALRDASAERQAAAVRTTDEIEAASASRDAAWLAEAIARHERAVAAARVALRDSRDPDVRRLAEAEIDAGTRALAVLRPPAA